jgi:hypothetical protein
MKSQSVISALRTADLLEEVRELVARIKSITTSLDAFTHYLTVLPPARISDPHAEPLVVACVRNALAAVNRLSNTATPQPEIERAFIVALFELAPRVVDMSICHMDIEDPEQSECWVPFAESISEFLSRYPHAKVVDAPSLHRHDLGDEVVRELMVARILPAELAVLFVEPQVA